MNLLGVHLSLLIGPTIPTPAPLALAEALQSAEVTHSDRGPSAFQLTFHIGRPTPLDLLDYALLRNPRLKVFHRVVLVVRFALLPRVIMDGIITNLEVNPGNDPGTSTLTATGEDVSVMMDLEESAQPFPSLADNLIVTALAAPYLARFRMAPKILPPPRLQVPLPTERVPHQAYATDRDYIQYLADRHGYVFYVTPGPAPLTNVLYWGPPERLNEPQNALSVNMGPNTNVESINFRSNALAPNKVLYIAGETERTIERPSPPPARVPLARNRLELRRQVAFTDSGGMPEGVAEAQAQALVDRSLDEAVTATGELDALRYNALLKPRGLVGVRGVGQTYDGLYYVKSVTHSLRKGQYRQRFTLTREGTGATLPLVRP
jgi:hypothetical protein